MDSSATYIFGLQIPKYTRISHFFFWCIQTKKVLLNKLLQIMNWIKIFEQMWCSQTQKYACHVVATGLFVPAYIFFNKIKIS